MFIEASEKCHKTIFRVFSNCIDEQLYPIDHPPLTATDVRVYCLVISETQLERFYNERELDFSFNFTLANGEIVRFRGNCFFERGNLALALRLIPQRIRLIKHLLLPPQIQEVTKRRHGLFLVTGPTGHGKSTTLAAIIQEINLTRSCHIVTIEDPIEYIFTSAKSLIHQREIEVDTSSFAEALRRVLRQDPDVIMIGEMRDLETTRAAITAAETGHLVLTTLHTPDSPQSIDRILDIFPPHQQEQVNTARQHIDRSLFQSSFLPGGGRIVATELCGCFCSAKLHQERKIHG